MHKRQLLMLRHGITEANEKRVFTGAMDIPLSPHGKMALKEISGTYPPGALYFTSGMVRAKQTLALLYGDVPAIDMPDLAEYRFGDFEGRGHADLWENEPQYREWVKREDMDIACPGGESYRMFDARVRLGFDVLCAHAWQGLSVLIAHGGVLAAIMRLYAHKGAWSQPPCNACGYRLHLGEGSKITGYEAFP